MRELSSTLLTQLESTATTLCWAWRIKLMDGTVLGFTDHDETLVFDGVTHDGETGLIPGDTDQRLGFEYDTGHVQGILSGTQISPADIAAGRFENAVIESYRVNWQHPDQFVHMSSGRIGKIRQQGDRFEAEWIGHGSVLDRSIGRVFSRLCDAELGDARCGLDVTNFPQSTQCPRTFSACRDQFNNISQFRGFPYLLGDDALQSGPLLVYCESAVWKPRASG